MFLKYLYDVLIPSAPPFLIRVSFDLKGLLSGIYVREAFVLFLQLPYNGNELLIIN
jgi:hypothetical protein